MLRICCGKPSPMGKSVFLCHFLRDLLDTNESAARTRSNHVDVPAARRYRTTNSAGHLERKLCSSDIPASRSARQQQHNAIITTTHNRMQQDPSEATCNPEVCRRHHAATQYYHYAGNKSRQDCEIPSHAFQVASVAALRSLQYSAPHFTGLHRRRLCTPESLTSHLPSAEAILEKGSCCQPSDFLPQQLRCQRCQSIVPWVPRPCKTTFDLHQGS